MLLSEALNKLKNLKSKASRTEGYINESAIHYEDTPPQYDYESEFITLKNLNEEILMLKAAIQITNANTKIEFEGQTMTLTELILRNAAIRSELAFIAKQMQHSVNERHTWPERTKDTIKKVFAKGYDKAMFKVMIDQLEKRKENLEAAIADANSKTRLIGP